jgi:hypothetical protein
MAKITKNNSPSPPLKLRGGRGALLVIEVWLLELIWDLEFGYWNLYWLIK